MDKIKNDEGKLVLVRLPWMQEVMNITYNFVLLGAITSGSIKGLWEYEITKYLQILYKHGEGRSKDLIRELLEETGASGMNAQFEKAGYLITQSKITEQ